MLTIRYSEQQRLDYESIRWQITNSLDLNLSAHSNTQQRQDMLQNTIATGFAEQERLIHTGISVATTKSSSLNDRLEDVQSSLPLIAADVSQISTTVPQVSKTTV